MISFGRRELGIIVLWGLLPQPPSVIKSFSLRAVEVDRGLYNSFIGVIIRNSPPDCFCCTISTLGGGDVRSRIDEGKGGQVEGKKRRKRNQEK